MKFFVYILYSNSLNKYYIGQTYDLIARLEKHQDKTTRFTKQADDWKLVYNEEYSTRKGAMNREKEIKRIKSKQYIQNLILQNER